MSLNHPRGVDSTIRAEGVHLIIPGAKCDLLCPVRTATDDVKFEVSEGFQSIDYVCRLFLAVHGEYKMIPQLF